MCVYVRTYVYSSCSIPNTPTGVPIGMRSGCPISIRACLRAWPGRPSAEGWVWLRTGHPEASPDLPPGAKGGEARRRRQGPRQVFPAPGNIVDVVAERWRVLRQTPCDLSRSGRPHPPAKQGREGCQCTLGAGIGLSD